MKAGAEVYFQCAMAYTNSQLKRRIRVHTLAIPVTADIGVVFRHLDLDTVTNVMLKNGTVATLSRAAYHTRRFRSTFIVCFLVFLRD